MMQIDCYQNTLKADVILKYASTRWQIDVVHTYAAGLVLLLDVVDFYLKHTCLFFNCTAQDKSV